MTALIAIFIGVLVKVFSVVNPFGALPMYLTMTADYSQTERNRTAFQTSFYFILVLMAFFWAGTSILNFFGLTVNALRIAGGLIILNSSFALLNDRFAQSRGLNEKVQEDAKQKQDISFSPLAMPMLAGPGSISLLIGYFADYEMWEERLTISGVIIVNGIIVYLVLRLAPYFYRVLGVSGLKAGSRIMGFLTMAIGVQFIITGVVALVKSLQ